MKKGICFPADALILIYGKSPEKCTCCRNYTSLFDSECIVIYKIMIVKHNFSICNHCSCERENSIIYCGDIDERKIS